MAAVLRSAARRLAGELPAAEMGLHRLPLHSQANVWSASSAPRSAPSSLTKTKAVIESTLLPQLIPRRTMSSSSGRAASQPADKFCFYLRGARMTAMQEPGSKELSMIIFVRSEEESLNDFWYFMSVVKKNEVQRAKEMEYRHMQSRYDKEWEKVENQPWFRKLENLQDHLSNKAWVLIPGGLLLAGLGESSDWKLLRGPHAPPPGPGEEAPFEKNPVEDML
ncbi:hypothetical protein CFC21_013132 [Triticum aestivum]|uniref:Uncharacterized protein n=3 Tax=Triticinae TaxID=1648030 RepID=A0A3B5ZYP2_WHEAT|nr:uncharacterized protein LOC123182637 isoform X4 [Triticum aestivum]KAF6996840.1 hypothetical protein CFC21_013132 [Triticum aestivum]